MKTETSFLHKADGEKNNLTSVFSSEGTSIYNPLPSETTQGKKKEKDRENVFLNIAPSSILKCDSVYNHIHLS